MCAGSRSGGFSGAERILPEVHINESGLAGSADTEALVICIETSCGDIFLNIAMRYLHRRRAERSAVPALD